MSPPDGGRRVRPAGNTGAETAAEGSGGGIPETVRSSHPGRTVLSSATDVEASWSKPTTPTSASSPATWRSRSGSTSRCSGWTGSRRRRSIQWLACGNRQLHVVESDAEPPAFNHCAINVDDFEGVFQPVREYEGAEIETLPGVVDGEAPAPVYMSH